MRFEWDDQKGLINKEKHGIDFEAAKSLWLDDRRVEIKMAGLSRGEEMGSHSED